MGLCRILLGVVVISLSSMGADLTRKLVWADEFSGSQGSKPDPSKWTFDLGGNGWGNQELENYTDQPRNAFLDGEGHLVIRAMQEKGGFTSARIKTQGHFSFSYGRVEARLKIASGQGAWPAFWMLGDNVDKAGWPACGEIDIMENIGREPGVVHGTVHGPGYSGKFGISRQFAEPGGVPLSNQFHVYAADWTPSRIAFSIDEHVYAIITPETLPAGTKWVYDHNFFVILNLAVGGAWPGNPDQSSLFPKDYTIDYVRVYANR